GAATVSIAWSEYLNNLLGGAIPYEWCHSPFEHLYKVLGDNIKAFPSELSRFAKDGELVISTDQYLALPEQLKSLVAISNGFVNLPALIILTILTLLLIKGTR